MRLRDFPVVEQVLSSGADDWVLDSLLLLGPVVLIVLALLGRSPLSIGLALTYLAAFVFHVLRVGLASSQ